MLYLRVLVNINMTVEKNIDEILTEELGNLGYELIKANSFQRGKRRILRIFIAHPDRSITIDDCVGVSKSLSLVLDELDGISGPYNLEVSSPGVKRPLVKPEHFEQFRGKKARVQFINEKGNKQSLTGEISGTDGSSVVLRLKEDTVRIELKRITRANLDTEPVGIGKGKKGKKKKRRK